MSSLTLLNVKSSKINLLFLNLNLYSFTFPFSDFNVLFNSGIKSKLLPLILPIIIKLFFLYFIYLFL